MPLKVTGPHIVRPNPINIISLRKKPLRNPVLTHGRFVMFLLWASFKLVLYPKGGMGNFKVFVWVPNARPQPLSPIPEALEPQSSVAIAC